MLASEGVYPPRPEGLSDSELADHLWRVIEALARRSVYFSHTNHLSDCELYTLLLDRILPEPTQDFPPDSGWNTHVMVDEYGTSDGQAADEVFLRYYADSETRRQWAVEFPDIRIPDHEPPRYDRDGRLPEP
jgi:hypothetical protein